MRKVIFWLHLLVGLLAGCLILSMAISGILIAWQPQLLDLAERKFRVPAIAGDAPLSPETLLGKAAAARPDLNFIALTLRADPGAPARATFGSENVLLLNPYNGEVLGEGASQLRGFFRWMTSWHRWLALEGARKETGKSVTGAASLAFLGMVLSGFYLWWPRRWSRKVLQAVAVPSLRLRGKSRDFNWHNALGLWCTPLLLILTLTGIIMAYPWANDLLFRLTGNEPPPVKKEGGAGGPRPMATQPVASPQPPRWTGLNPLWHTAAQRLPGWKIISARFNGPPGQVNFFMNRGDGGRPDLVTMLAMNAKTGEVIRWEPFSSYNAGKRLRMWTRSVHTGEAAGGFGQALAMSAGLGTIILIWTGFALAFRRFAASRKRAREEPALPSETP